MFYVDWSFGQNNHIVQIPYRKRFGALQLDCFLSFANVGIYIAKDLGDSFVLNLRSLVRKP